MAWLSAKLLAARPCGGEAGFHALAEEVSLKLRDPGEHGGHHTPVRCVEFEGHTVHGHNRDFPACEPVQSIQQVLCGPPPSGKFADQDRVNLSGLCKIEQSVARGAINAGPGGRFFENADDVVTPAFREGCQFGDLSLARLVRGRNPRINCGALSQLNPLGF